MAAMTSAGRHGAAASLAAAEGAAASLAARLAEAALDASVDSSAELAAPLPHAARTKPRSVTDHQGPGRRVRWMRDGDDMLEPRAETLAPVT